MSNINELAINDSTINEQYVRKYGTFKLQSDKEITENGKHTADVGFNGLSSVNVNVEGGGKVEQTKSVTITENGTTTVTPDVGKTLSSVNITTNVSGGGSETMWYAWVNEDDEDEIYYCDTEIPINGSTRAYSNSGSQMIVNNYINGNIEVYIRDVSGMWVTLTYVRNSDYDTPYLMMYASITPYGFMIGDSFSYESPYIGIKNVYYSRSKEFTVFTKSSGVSIFPTNIVVRTSDIDNGESNYNIYELYGNLPTDEITWKGNGSYLNMNIESTSYDSDTDIVEIHADPEGTGEDWIAKYTNYNKYYTIIEDSQNMCIHC